MPFTSTIVLHVNFRYQIDYKNLNQSLRSSLQRISSKTKKTTIIDNKWIPSSELTDRSVLSDELANFCAKYPIYYVKKLEDSLTSMRIQTGGERHSITV